MAAFLPLKLSLQRVVERIYGVSSSTLVIQDGRDAGQSIDHVHLHIMPRRPGDFKVNDEVWRGKGPQMCLFHIFFFF